MVRLADVNNPPAHPFSRYLLLGWCLWLLACWFFSGWLEGTSAMATLPRMRTAQLLAWIGATLVWPVWRLSVSSRVAAGPSTVCDMISLWIGYQVLAARMWMDFRESLRAPLVDLVFTVSLLGVGLWVFLGRRSGSAGRTACMALCVATVAAGSLLTPWLGGSAWAMVASPARAIWLLCSERSPVTAEPLAAALGWAALGWLGAWVAVALLLSKRRRQAGEGAAAS